MLRIAQLSDFHFSCLTANPFRLFSKRFFGLANFILNRKKTFSQEPLHALPPLLHELKVDALLLGGDFCTTSLLQEFRLAKQFVDKLPQTWIAIPGNHDCYTKQSHRKKHFYRYFTNRPSPFPFSLLKEGVEAHPLSPDWWIVCLDTARATSVSSSRGLFSISQEKALKQVLSQIPQEASVLLFNHYPFAQNDEHHRTLERGEELEMILRSDPQIKAYLHGHTHRHILADLQPSGLPLVLDGGCCGDGAKGSWNLLSIDSDKIRIEPYHWTQGRWLLGKEEQVRWNR